MIFSLARSLVRLCFMNFYVARDSWSHSRIGLTKRSKPEGVGGIGITIDDRS